MSSESFPLSFDEINKYQGFPSPERERELQWSFFGKFQVRALEFALKQAPDWRPTPNQAELYLATLYGIYFYNLVCGGLILSGHTSCNFAANLYREILLGRPAISEGDLPLAADDLANWPIVLTTKYLDLAETEGGLIVIPLAKLPNADPKEKMIYYAVSPLRQKVDDLLHLNKTNTANSAPYHYVCDYYNQFILGGIEEAQHSHFDYLERIHYGASFPQSNPVGPLRSLITRQRLDSTKNVDSMYPVAYHSLLGHEFAAHIVQAEYVRRYLPEFWNSGYQDYHEKIKKLRQKKLSRQS